MRVVQVLAFFVTIWGLDVGLMDGHLTQSAIDLVREAGRERGMVRRDLRRAELTVWIR